MGLLDKELWKEERGRLRLDVEEAGHGRRKVKVTSPVAACRLIETS